MSFLSLLLDSSGILRATQQATPFTPAAAADPADPSGRGTTFKDVHGVEEAKLELFEIVEFLKDPSKFEKLGGKLPRGILLTGASLIVGGAKLTLIRPSWNRKDSTCSSDCGRGWRCLLLCVWIRV